MESFTYGRKRRRHTKAIAVGVVVGLLTASSIAFAAWVVNGSGSGYGKAGTPVNLSTIDILGTELTGDLFPGGTGGLSIKIQNNNGFPVSLTSVTSAGSIASDDAANCPSSNFSFIAKSGLNLGPIPANGSGTVVVPGATALSGSAPTGCQGIRARFPISFTAVSG